MTVEGLEHRAESLHLDGLAGARIVFIDLPCRRLALVDGRGIQLVLLAERGDVESEVAGDVFD